MLFCSINCYQHVDPFVNSPHDHTCIYIRLKMKGPQCFGLLDAQCLKYFDMWNLTQSRLYGLVIIITPNCKGFLHEMRVK